MLKRRKVLPLKLRIRVWLRDKKQCHYCGKKLPRPGGAGSRVTQMDHAIPYSKGGSDTEDNIVASCKICNRSKANTDYASFLSREIENAERKLKALRSNLLLLKRRGLIISGKRKGSFE